MASLSIITYSFEIFARLPGLMILLPNRPDQTVAARHGSLLYCAFFSG